jgi:drug/metabolite transporter (DMT)-like permease
MRKDRLDAFGGPAALTGVTLLLAFNQILVKWVNEGAAAGLLCRAAVGAGDAVFVALWLVWRGQAAALTRPARWGPGLLIGTIFAAEFLCLFLALDLTTVSRAAVIFYSMPVWFALMAHVLLPGERLTLGPLAGLALAFTGTAWAILSRSGAGGGQPCGRSLRAWGRRWAGQAPPIGARLAPARGGAEMQLFWMVLVSAPILLLAAPLSSGR